MYRPQDHSVTAVSPRTGDPHVVLLLVGNKQAARIVVRCVNWVFWLIVAWLAGSVAVAVLFGRVILIRDEREIPRPFRKDDTERWRDAS